MAQNRLRVKGRFVKSIQNEWLLVVVRVGRVASTTAHHFNRNLFFSIVRYT